MSRRRARPSPFTQLPRTAAFAAGLVLGLGGLLMLWTGPALADSGNDGVGISVDVTGPTSTPTVTPTPQGSGGGDSQGSGGGGDSQGSGGSDSGNSGGGSGNGQGGASGGTGNGGGSKGSGSTGKGAQDDGPLNISGLHAEYIPALNPAAGTVNVSFSVHNGSKSPIASSVHFWLEGPVGNTVSDTGRYPVPTIKPGETVVIRSVLGNVGQWTVLTAHAKYFPPGSVDGITLKALARDVAIFAFPWLNTAGAVASVAGISILALARPGLLAGLLQVVRR